MNNRLELDATQTVSLLADLCRLMSQAPLTVDDVKADTAKLPLKASVQPEPGTDAPAFVRLELPDSCQLTLDDLSEFGPYKRLPRLHREGPDEFIFHFDLPEYPYTSALIIEKLPDEPTAKAVTVRRDIRLE